MEEDEAMKKCDKEHLFDLAKAFHDAWLDYVKHQLDNRGVGDYEISKQLEAKVRIAETDLTLFCANAHF